MKAITVIPGKPGASLSDMPDVQAVGLVRVRTLHTGICGTDREIVAGRLSIARPGNGNTLILGHEAVGMVEDAPASSGFSRGNVVVPMVRRPGGCVNCRNGRQDYCIDGDFVEAGIRGKDGFMRDYFYEKPEFLVKVGNPANARTCVLAEPTKNIMKILEAVTLSAKRAMWDISGGVKGKGTWIFGTGAEGLLSAAVLADAGASVTIVNRRDLTQAEKGIAGRIGARFFNSSSGEWDAALEANKMDMVIDAVGVPDIFTEVIPRLERNGIIVLFGTGGQGEVALFDGGKIIKLVDKNATVIGCEDGARSHYESAVAFIEKNRERYGLDSIITGHSSNQDLEVLGKKDAGEIKSIIDW